MKRSIVGLTALAVIALGILGLRMAGQERTTIYALHTPFVSTDAASIAAITVPGTAPVPYVLGTYVSGGSNVTGMSPPDAWAHALDPIFDPTAPDALDYHWIWVRGTPVIWDLGSPSSWALVFPSIDHGPMSPAPYEALEFTVWGSNDASAPFPGSWTLGTLTTVYEDGWTDVGAAQESDDFASLWSFGISAFQFIAVYANYTIEITPEVGQENQCAGEGVWCSFDAEIDAVGMPLQTTPIPTPPPPVGGISVDPEVGALPVEASGSSRDNAGRMAMATLIAAIAASAIALGGAAWYAKRRWFRR